MTFSNAIFSAAAAAFALAILTACATPGENNKARGIAAFDGDPRLGEEVKKVCFNQSIDGFTSTTRDTVVLTKGVSDEYIIEVFGACPNLRSAQRIALDSVTSCLSKSDYLIVYDSAFGTDSGLGPDRCSIRRIHAWDSDAETTDDVADDNPA